MSGCDCGGPGTPEHPCSCPDAGVIGQTSFGMRPLKMVRAAPGGVREWGSAPGWTGFRRPIQTDELEQTHDLVRVLPPVAGRHVNRITSTDDGGAVSLMGEPCPSGALFPQVVNTGYLTAAGRP